MLRLIGTLVLALAYPQSDPSEISSQGKPDGMTVEEWIKKYPQPRYVPPKKPLISFCHEEDRMATTLEPRQLPANAPIIYIPSLDRGFCGYEEPGITYVIGGANNRLLAQADRTLKKARWLGDHEGLADAKLSKVNLIYDETGKFVVFAVYRDSPILTPSGFILKNAATIASGEVGVREALNSEKPVAEFSFHSAEQDVLGLSTGALIYAGDELYKGLNLSFDEAGVVELIRNVPDDPGFFKAFFYAQEESQGGELDSFFRMAKIKRWTATANLNELIYFEGRAYNRRDFGNFVWGAGVAKLGFPKWFAQLAAENNAVWKTRSQNGQGKGIILKGDSDRDQEAICRGMDFWLRESR